MKLGEKLDLDEVIRRVDEISTLPHIAFRVMEVANNPDSGAIDLKELVETDAALSARILRCVNSSAYALRTEITNLQQAIAFLGLKQIRNLAITASVSELFTQDDQIGSYSRSGLWRHLVAVAICSRLIAMRCKFRDFEDAFLAGLLHDIGIILEDQQLHPEFVEVIGSLPGAKSLIDVEKRVLGFDHTLLGEGLAERWGFPEHTKAAIRYHHASINYRGKHIDILRCIDVANLICTLAGMSSVGIKLVNVSQPALKALSISKNDIVVLAEDLKKELAASASLFNI